MAHVTAAAPIPMRSPTTEHVFATPARPGPNLTLGSFVAPSTFTRDSEEGGGGDPDGTANGSGGAALYRTFSQPSASRGAFNTSQDDDDESDGEYEGRTRGIAAAPEDEVLDDLLVEGVDGLPAYTPRISAVHLRRLAMKKHTFASRSQKIGLEIQAPGENGITIVEGMSEAVADTAGGTTIKGELCVNLPAAEAITHIRIRLRAVIQTMCMRIQGSGRHPVTEELMLWEDAKTLWSSSEPHLSNSSSDPAKLRGTFNFPFDLYIPSRVTVRVSERDGTPGLVKKVRMPPSFVLTADGSGNHVKAEWASCRYFIKVTLGRRGLLKSNERLIVPLTYQPKPADPGGSVLRMAALASNTPVPGHREDPGGWAGKKVRQQVKKGMFGGKKRAWYQITLYLPQPAKFCRFTSIPFALKIESSDPSVTGKFPRETISVGLVQRAFVSAQATAGSHDVYVAKAQVDEDGPPGGEYVVGRDVGNSENTAVWSTHYSGNLRLQSNVGSTFRAPNLVCSFVLTVHISVPGTGNDCVLTWPVEILAALPSLAPSTTADPDSQPSLTRVMSRASNAEVLPRSPSMDALSAAIGMSLSPDGVTAVMPPSYAR